MVQKNNQQLLREFSRVGKGNNQFSSVTLGDYDYEEDDDEEPEMERVEETNDVEVNIITSSNTETEKLPNTNPKLRKQDSCNENMPSIVLVMLFVEKFVDITAVFLLTLLAVLWSPFHKLLDELLWALITFFIFILFALILLYRIPWFRRFPGCILYKLIYLHLLIIIFFTLAVHFPKDLPFLSTYFALVAAGTVGATYILFAFVSVTHKHFCKIDAKGCTLWRYGFVMPLFILLISQPIYLCFASYVDYTDYIVNIVAGILTSLPFIYETLFIYHRFVSSKDLEEFIHTTGLLPGFVTATFNKQLEEDGNNEDTQKKHCRI